MKVKYTETFEDSLDEYDSGTFYKDACVFIKNVQVSPVIANLFHHGEGGYYSDYKSTGISFSWKYGWLWVNVRLCGYTNGESKSFLVISGPEAGVVPDTRTFLKDHCIQCSPYDASSISADIISILYKGTNRLLINHPEGPRKAYNHMLSTTNREDQEILLPLAKEWLQKNNPNLNTPRERLHFNKKTGIPKTKQAAYQFIRLMSIRIPGWISRMLEQITKPDAALSQEESLVFTNIKYIQIQIDTLTELPEWIQYCTNLTELHLNSESRKNKIPIWIGKLIHLERLFISNKTLKELPEELALCTNLRELCLLNTRISSLPEGIAHMPNLWKLTLSSFVFTKLPDNAAHYFSKYTIKDGKPSFPKLLFSSSLGFEYDKLQEEYWLSLFETLLEGVRIRDKKDPEALKSIEYLDVNDIVDRLPKTWPSALSIFSCVPTIDLRKVHSLHTIPDILYSFTAIRTLLLRGIKIIPERLAELQTLETLEIETYWTKEIRVDFSSLPNFTKLILSRDSGYNPATKEKLIITGEVSSISMNTFDWPLVRDSLLRMKQLKTIIVDDVSYPFDEQRRRDLDRVFAFDQGIKKLNKGELYQELEKSLGLMRNRDFFRFYRPGSKQSQYRKAVKRVWNEHADHHFLNTKVLTIHWLGWLVYGPSGKDSLDLFLKRYPLDSIHKDEFSAHGYTKGGALEKSTPFDKLGILIGDKYVSYASTFDAYTQELHLQNKIRVLQNQDGSPRSYYPKDEEMEPVEGTKDVSVQELYTHSGVPKQPNPNELAPVFSQLEVPKDGFIKELIIDNWQWEAIVWTGTTEEPFYKELIKEYPVVLLSELKSRF